jgi:hypothetical protein
MLQRQTNVSSEQILKRCFPGICLAKPDLWKSASEVQGYDKSEQSLCQEKKGLNHGLTLINTALVPKKVTSVPSVFMRAYPLLK